MRTRPFFKKNNQTKCFKFCCIHYQIYLIQQIWSNQFDRVLVTIVACLTGLTNSQMVRRFNNYITLKLPFLTHLPPIITLCHVCSWEPSCVLSRSAQTIYPLPIENEISGFKKDRSRSKEISFPFHMFFFQLSTNNTKRVYNIFKKQSMSLLPFPYLNWFYTI